MSQSARSILDWPAAPNYHFEGGVIYNVHMLKFSLWSPNFVKLSLNNLKTAI